MALSGSDPSRAVSDIECCCIQPDRHPVVFLLFPLSVSSSLPLSRVPFDDHSSLSLASILSLSPSRCVPSPSLIWPLSLMYHEVSCVHSRCLTFIASHLPDSMSFPAPPDPFLDHSSFLCEIAGMDGWCGNRRGGTSNAR